MRDLLIQMVESAKAGDLDGVRDANHELRFEIRALKKIRPELREMYDMFRASCLAAVTIHKNTPEIWVEYATKLLDYL